MATLREWDWTYIAERIRDGRFVPIISDRFSWDLTGLRDEMLHRWAERYQYPGGRSSRVDIAEYVIAQSDRIYATRSYLDDAKRILLAAAEQAGRLPPVDDKQLRKMTVTELAKEIAFRPVTKDGYDPFAFLAQLPLPIYITTGFHGFLEQALREQGKEPIVEICQWHDPGRSTSEPNRSYEPERPLVFYLMGHDSEPDSLVMTHRDYLQFLTALARYPDVVAPVIRRTLTTSSPLLLGYRVQDWEFRTVYRGLIMRHQSSLRRFSVATQPDPKSFDTPDPEAVTGYLERYFDAGSFSIYWGDLAFLHELAEHWES